MLVAMNDAQISAPSVCSAAVTSTKNATKKRISVTTTSIRPEAMWMPRPAGGRSSATASPVTRSSVVRVANSGADIAVSLGAR